MLSGIWDLKPKLVKNAGQRLQALFTGAEFSAKFHCILCKIHWSKPYTAFVKVVEGQLIYNFGIDCLWHFSCKILSKTWSKCASSNSFVTGLQSARPRRRRASPRRGSAGPGRRGGLPPAGPCVVGSPSPNRLPGPTPAPRVARPAAAPRRPSPPDHWGSRRTPPRVVAVPRPCRDHDVMVNSRTALAIVGLL
jgi:hypothetical protein